MVDGHAGHAGTVAFECYDKAVTAAPPAAAPLAGLRVLDVATVIAGPACARYLADFGADVIKVERPRTGDSTRTMGWLDADGDSYWWKLTGRNKRSIALDLKDPDDVAVFRRLVAGAHVLVENFRPGTLERLGLGPDVLLTDNPALVITRVTGFGQDGPYAGRPGFATIAEAMSGLAAITGTADGPPLLPPIALTDEVTALVAAFATMVALRSGTGQVVDVSLLESVFQILGPLLTLYARDGVLQERLGSGIPYSVPRGTYRTADGRWVALSASADTVAARVMTLIGLGDDDRVASFTGRMAHRDLVESTMATWIAARTEAEVLDAFAQAEAAVAPVMTMADVAADPHVSARGMVAEVGGVPMQGLVARLTATPGVLRWAGPSLDADGPAIRADQVAGGDGWGGVSPA